MSHIFNKVRDLDVSSSENVKETVSSFVQILSKSTGEGQLSWLTALEDIINRFPKYCFPHRSNIETYLVKFLDSYHYQNVVTAAKCAHLLQQVRPSQEKTATPKTCWREQMTLLCESAHSLIGAIFTDAVDVHKPSDQRRQEQDASLTSDSPLTTALLEICVISTNYSEIKDKDNLLCRRLGNLFIFIQAMLVEMYPVAKPVRPQTVLDVVIRTITVTSSNLNKLSSNEFIYSLKSESLRTLDALILCLRSNLIPFSPLIFRVAMQTLRWTSDNVNDESTKVRIQTYNTLKTWLTTLHCDMAGASQTQREAKGKSASEQLVEHFVKDVTPASRVVTLTMNAQPTKHLSKKAKRKLANTQLHESSIASHIPGASNKGHRTESSAAEDVALAALECLETFLTVCGIFVKPNIHKVLQSTLVRECYKLQEYSESRALRLCRALDACRKSVASNVSPPTQYCLSIFSDHVASPRPELSSFCSRALLDIRLHLHCSPPSLNFANPETSASKKAGTTKKVVSERNRAALEALLGANKLPNNKSEEIITIADEPSTKKARLEDNISISSQSSVEIDDDEIDHENEEIEEIQEILDETETSLPVRHQDETIDIDDLIEEPIIIEDKTDNDNIFQSQNVVSNMKIVDIETAVSNSTNLHELKTQLPVNLSNDTVDGQESSHSVEIDYDYPNSTKSNVPTLEKLDDENLPSTNETDDIQITCGQLLKSQEVSQKKVDDNKENEPKNNGELMNGDVVVKSSVGEATVKIGNEALTVDDMLADFVDEVNDEVDV